MVGLAWAQAAAVRANAVTRVLNFFIGVLELGGFKVPENGVGGPGRPLVWMEAYRHADRSKNRALARQARPPGSKEATHVDANQALAWRLLSLNNRAIRRARRVV